MTSEAILRVDGEVECPLEMSFADLEAIDAAMQVADVSRIDAGRAGDAVKLAGLLSIVRPLPSVVYLTLHASTDDFHASIPLAPIHSKALLIYRLDGQPLPPAKGGPLRLLIPDSAACHSEEIDECANVKFIDRIELSTSRGHDNRPETDEEHQRLHRSSDAE